MDDAKTYIVGQDTNNGWVNLIAPLLQQRGIDANTLLAMQNGNGFGNNGSWFIWVLFLLMFGGNGNWGNNSNTGAAALGNMINNNDGRELLMQAIQGNNNAIDRLANMLSSSTGEITQSINSVMSQVQSVASSVGMTGQQVINAIQQGNCSIGSQLCQGFNNLNLGMCQQTNAIQTAINNVSTAMTAGFADLNYNTQRQTCDITSAIKESTATIVAGQTAAEMRELNRDIAERDRKIAEMNTTIVNGQQSQMFAQTGAQMIAPLNAAIAQIQAELVAIKGQLPSTTVLPYSPVTAVPTYVASQLGVGNTNPWG